MNDDFEFLSATAKIFVDTPGIDPALEALARMAVPALADVCAIQVVDGNQNVESITLARIDAEAESQVSVTQTRPAEGEARPASHASLLQAMSAESHLVLPLASRGSVLGCIAFGLTQAGGFLPQQLRWAEDFARGVTLGLENAMLSRTASRLERDRAAAEAARARAEAALFQGENTLRILVEHHPDMTCMMEAGPGGSYLAVMGSPAWIRALGLEGKDWKGRSIDALFHASAAEFYREIFDRVVASGAQLSIEKESRLVPGMWVQSLYFPVRNADGAITHILASSRDVTTLKKAHMEAAAGRELLKDTLNALRDPVSVIAPGADRPLFANEAPADALGLVPPDGDRKGGGREHAGESFQVFDNEGHRLAGNASAGFRAAQGETIDRELQRLVNVLTGSETWHEVSASPRKDPAGNLLRSVLTSHDVTGFKQAEQASRERESLLRKTADLNAYRLNLAESLGPLGDALEIQRAAGRALGESMDVARACYCELLVPVDGEFRALRQQWNRPGAAGNPGRFRVEDFGAGVRDTLNSGRHFAFSDIANDPALAPETRATLLAQGVQAAAGVPLIKGGRLVAVLGVSQDAPRAWSPEDIRLLEETAERTWLAAERAAIGTALAESRVELQRHHELLQAILHSHSDLILVYDKGGKPIYANDAFARFLGYASAAEALAGFDRDRFKAYTVFDAQGREVPPERDPAARAWQGEINRREPMRFVKAGTGEELWMEVTSLPLAGAGGEIERVFVSSPDVTTLRNSHAEAGRARELLDAAINASHDALKILDPAGRLLYANEAAARFMGFASVAAMESARDKGAPPPVDILDESGKAMPESGLASVRVLRGEVPDCGCILQLRDRDTGRIRWVENRAASVQDEWGRVKLVSSAMVDITRLKAAQEAVAIHEGRLRLALDAGRVGIWDLDVRTDRLEWSDRMCAMHGRLPGSPPRNQAEFLALIHPDDRGRVIAAFLAADDRDFFEIEYRIPIRFGESRWFYSSGGCQRGPDGKAQRFIGAAIEITQRKRAEEAASLMHERVRKVKHMDAIGRMAGGMSHDFNNLLTAINGYADLILSTAVQDRAVHVYAGNIRESGERALKITQQLLAYSQRQLLETAVIDVNEIARSMIELVRKLVDENLLLIPVLSPAPEPIKADAGKLKQAMMNVILNSLDAMPDGGRLTVSTFFTRLPEPIDTADNPVPAGDYVVIEIADTGAGIEPENLPRIFEPYFTTKAFGVKSGLGLSMVQGMVRQHGGHVQVTSEKGVGTRFRMYFPPADQSAPPAPEARSALS